MYVDLIIHKGENYTDGCIYEISTREVKQRRNKSYTVERIYVQTLRCPTPPCSMGRDQRLYLGKTLEVCSMRLCTSGRFRVLRRI
jgi:hypothetical protein